MDELDGDGVYEGEGEREREKRRESVLDVGLFLVLLFCCCLKIFSSS